MTEGSRRRGGSTAKLKAFIKNLFKLRLRVAGTVGFNLFALSYLHKGLFSNHASRSLFAVLKPLGNNL